MATTKQGGSVIPAGRTAIDIAGIATLYGLTDSQARRRRPWADPGHPAPLTPGRPRTGRPQLWDREQAVAYSAGRPVPQLPDNEHQDDLLTLDESAALAGMKPDTWAKYLRTERAKGEPVNDDHGVELVPPPDEDVFGCPHWKRSTVEAYVAARQQRAGSSGHGRPVGRTETVKRAEIGQRIAALMDERDEQDAPLTIAEIARRVGVHYSTAHSWVDRLRRK